MATPHLRKTDLGSGSGASRYPLICDDDHLLIIQRSGNTTWNNKELVVTPAGEMFANACVFGEQTSYAASSYMGYNDADATAMKNALIGVRDGMTDASWHSGSRALFSYWSRGLPPYRLKVNTNETINSTAVVNTIELATTFRLLKFNLHAFPIGNCTAFKAYWRVWHPSCMISTWNGTAYSEDRLSLLNSAGVMRYKFASVAMPPKFHQDTTGGGYGTANIVAVANQGDSGYHAYTTSYNPWDGPAAGYAAFKRHLDSSGNNYHADIEITGDGLTSLKNVLTDATIGGGDGHVYAHLGFNIADAQSASSTYATDGQPPRSVILLWVSRIELRLVATWN